MAGVCQNTYGPKAFKDESTCRSAKCNACMLIGDGFQDGMVTAEQVELEKVGRRSLRDQPVRIHSKRAHKNKITSSDTVVKKAEQREVRSGNRQSGAHVVAINHVMQLQVEQLRFCQD